MPGKLIISSGEQKGKTFPLADELTVIGREPDCRIRLEAGGISRHHCQVERQGESFVLTDQGSRNGTFLNDRPVKREELRWGDRLRVGPVTLVFISERPDSSVVAPAAGGERFSATVSLVAGDEERPVGIRPGDAPPSPDGRRLEALFRLARGLQSARGLGGALNQLLRVLGEVTPARRGAVLVGRTPGEALAAPAVTGRSGRQSPLAVDEPALASVLAEGRALLLAGERSLLAPLIAPDGVVGAVFLEAEPGGLAFRREDLHFVTAVGALTGAAVRTLEEMEQLARRAAGAGDEVVGQSPGFKRLLDEVERVAAAGSTVLLLGESGSGKEVIARQIHRLSPRHGFPLVCVNCSAIPPGLAESELFGHEKGAFTGAAARHQGHFERADGGTIFLDEVGDLEPAAQAKLLRVLEERQLRRVGGSAPVAVDVRVLAATNRDLAALVPEKKFREDLYFRLRVIEITVPPLRERPGDIPLLARHFRERFSRETGRARGGFTDEALERLAAQPWPGNVRELRNAVERAVVLARGERIEAADLGFPAAAAGPAGPADRPLTLAAAEREHIRRVLGAADWNRTRAAELLGIDRKTLYAKIKAYGLAP